MTSSRTIKNEDDGQVDDNYTAEEQVTNDPGDALLSSMRSSSLPIPKVKVSDLVSVARFQAHLQARFQALFQQ